MQHLPISADLQKILVQIRKYSFSTIIRLQPTANVKNIKWQLAALCYYREFKIMYLLRCSKQACQPCGRKWDYLEDFYIYRWQEIQI